MAAKNPANKPYNQKSATVRKDRRLRPSKGNPTKGGKIFGNWTGRGSASQGGK